jgi:hypothetical protein
MAPVVLGKIEEVDIMYFKKMFIVLVLIGIISAVTGCILTRSFEPLFEIVTLSITPEPLRRQEMEDPVAEGEKVTVSPDSVLTFKNLRQVPCQLREYSIEYTLIGFERPLPEEWEDMPEGWEPKTPSEINKDLATYNRSGNLAVYLGAEEEKTVNLRIAWGGKAEETPGELYSYMENPNWDADTAEDVDGSPSPGDDPDIEVKAKVTVTGVDEYSKLIKTEAAVSINTDILIVVEE